jgi:hypothetical protein
MITVSLVHEVVAEAALLLFVGVFGVVFLEFVTGRALAILLYPKSSAEMVINNRMTKAMHPAFIVY